MDSSQTIRAVMHPFPHTIGLNQTLFTAKQLLREHGIRHLPVCDAGRLCGVLSDRDIEFALRVDQVPPQDLLVRDCFTAGPYAVVPDTATHEVARKMAKDHIGCALVVENGSVIGIFTTVDACRVLAEVLSGVKEQ